MTDSTQLVNIALGVAALAVIVAIFALFQVSRARKQLVIFRGQAQEQDILTTASELAMRNEDLMNRIQRLNQQLAMCQRDISEALRHVAVVRFDAVQDAGGQFSFSTAMLDDEGNGVVITSIQAHNQNRVYAKSIIEGKSQHPLTPEEQQAISAATPQGS